MELLSVIEARRPLYLGTALALVVGCAKDSTSAPSMLIDGSPVRPSSIAIEGVDGPLVATRLRVVEAGSRGGRSMTASCVPTPAPNSLVVERTSASGMSVTFVDPGQRGVHACDATDVSRTRAKSWCAHAFGRLSEARLRDPRLTIICRDTEGEPVGFAWVQPGRSAAFVVVQQPRYAESYAASGATPIRVTTTDIDVPSSRATLTISEHERDGTLLRSYDLEAQVAG